MFSPLNFSKFLQSVLELIYFPMIFPASLNSVTIYVDWWPYTGVAELVVGSESCSYEIQGSYLLVVGTKEE
ncbi:hypothetical protein BpHYR1_046200 [Brachionus plicatilis]|uniref:Uncharacterized protein n=1 Tax=Brachionus plicatilis TaxID=10195 RepID=A0A3M7Q4A7_BRAPC|nr:hypothetical protein BpHYR1_046200 [Brachionus plicatilis]